MKSNDIIFPKSSQRFAQNEINKANLYENNINNFDKDTIKDKNNITIISEKTSLLYIMMILILLIL